jgi:hypothetical protein
MLDAALLESQYDGVFTGQIVRTSAGVRNYMKQCDLRIESLGQIDRVPRRSNRSSREVHRKRDSALH